jgi:hypothetical protein
VYMPGYSGLEVCEKVKGSPETARVKVLLTVTNMEPFNPEDGNRVKADGLLIKPFEPTDLLAVIRKLEEKIRPAAPPEADTTTKMEVVEEFSDQGHADWKTATVAEAKTTMSHEIASAPVLGIEELTSEPPSALAAAAAPAPVAEQSRPAEELTFDVNAPAPAFDLEHVGPEEVIAPPSELEFTSAPQPGEVEVAPAPELEITAQENAAEVSIVQEPGLATDPSDFSQFATKFGQEHPEDVPVGIAMEEPPDEAGIHLVVAEPEAQESAPEISAVPEAALVIDPSDAQLLDNFTPEHLEEVAVAEEEPSTEIAEMQETAPEPAAQESAPEVTVVRASTGEDHPSEFEQFVSDFPHPEEVPVGVVMEEPHDAKASAPAAVRASGFEQEMRHVFEMSATTAVSPAYEAAPHAKATGDTQPLDIFPEPEPISPETEPVLEPEHPNALTEKLVAQFAAELDAAQQEPPPLPDLEPPAAAATASAPALDKQRIAEAVDRVLDRYRTELTRAILRELED